VEEDKWIKEFRPVYNVVQRSGVAGAHINPAGRKRSKEDPMSSRQMAQGNTFFGKTHREASKQLIREAALARTRSHKPAFGVDVLDTVTGVTESFNSIREVTRLFKCSITTVNKHNGLLYKDRYLINIRRPEGSG
jgi:hypothetical protein